MNYCVECRYCVYNNTWDIVCKGRVETKSDPVYKTRKIIKLCSEQREDVGADCPEWQPRPWRQKHRVACVLFGVVAVVALIIALSSAQ